jgi:hypothetical protein
VHVEVADVASLHIGDGCLACDQQLLYDIIAQLGCLPQTPKPVAWPCPPDTCTDAFAELRKLLGASIIMSIDRLSC